MRVRSGSTLLEVAIAIPIAFAILVGAIGLVHKTMIVTNLAKGHSDVRRTIGNLAIQFRDDVRESMEASIDMNGAGNTQRLLLFRSNQTPVIYEMDKSVIRRIDEKASQEQYLIPGGRTACVEWVEPGSRFDSDLPVRLRLSVKHFDTDVLKNELLEAEIEAVLGRRYRIRMRGDRNE